MCGRFNFTATPEEIAETFSVPPPPELLPRYNVAPSQNILVVARRENGQRITTTKVTWGLIPAGSPTADWKSRFPNARSETVDKLGSFQNSFRHKRCLIPATGFYEWKAEGKIKYPYNFQLESEKPFAFAAIWEFWEGNGQKMATTALLTTKPNKLVKPIHDRMPVILPREAYDAWLDPDATVDKLMKLLVPFTAEPMKVTAVSRKVNSVKNEGPDLLKPEDQGLLDAAVE